MKMPCLRFLMCAWVTLNTGRLRSYCVGHCKPILDQEQQQSTVPLYLILCACLL